MLCTNCGEDVAANKAYCSNCGRPLPKVAPPAESVSGASGAAAAVAPAPVSPWLDVPPAPDLGRQKRTDGKAITSLVFGILSIPLPVIGSVLAIIFGHISRSSIRKSSGRLTGEGVALAGLVMGYATIIGAALLFALIGIPNFYRAKLVANEASAAVTVGTLEAAQKNYSTQYPARGFARDLAALGPGEGKCAEPSDRNACLIDSNLGAVSCSAGVWCGQKSGFHYAMSAVCGAEGFCTNYVITASPVNSNSGRRSYCATADGMVHTRSGRVAAPISSAEECLSWPTR